MVAHTTERDFTPAEAADRADLREAYERGRTDARADRKRHPVAMTFTIVVALVGLVVIVLAAINGSFGRAGGVVDQNLATAADRAEPVVRDAAARTGETLRDAGQSVKDKAAKPAG
jgi:hypothetical protein